MRIFVKLIEDHSVEARVLADSPMRIMHTTTTTDGSSLYPASIDLDDTERNGRLGNFGGCRNRASQMSIGEQLEHLRGDAKRTERATDDND